MWDGERDGGGILSDRRRRAQRALARVLPAALLVAACGDDGTPAPTSAEALANATYLAEEAPEGRVTLVSGAFEFPPGGPIGRVELVSSAEGDLNGDDEPDAVTVLAESRGEERLLRLHALIGEDGEARDVAARLIGDRLDVRSLAVDHGLITVDALGRPAGEPAPLPPSVPVRMRFALTDRGLVPIPALRAGAASDAGSGADAAPGLATHEWVLDAIETETERFTGEALDRRPFVRFARDLGGDGLVRGQVAAFTGCNHAFGRFEAEPDGSLDIASFATTLRACEREAAEFEARLVASLRAASQWAIEGDLLTIPFEGGILRFHAGGRLELDLPDPDTAKAERPAPPSGTRPRT